MFVVCVGFHSSSGTGTRSSVQRMDSTHRGLQQQSRYAPAAGVQIKLVQFVEGEWSGIGK